MWRAIPLVRPYRWPNIQRRQSIAFIITRSSEHSHALDTLDRLDAIGAPAVIVHIGDISPDSRLDTFLHFRCQLDLEQTNAQGPCVFLAPTRPCQVNCLAGVLVIRANLSHSLAIECTWDRLARNAPAQSLLWLLAGTLIDSRAYFERILDESTDGVSLALAEPVRNHILYSIGAYLSIQTSRIVRWTIDRPRLAQENISGHPSLHFLPWAASQPTPALCVDASVASDDLFRLVATQFHPCDDHFGTFDSVTCQELLVKRANVPVRLVPRTTLGFLQKPNMRHVTNMILDQQDWLYDFVRPFRNLAFHSAQTVRLARLADAHSFAHLATALWLLIECAANAVNMFFPSIMVLFWIDIMPFVTYVAPWANDALLISHAFLLRTAIVSWSDQRPWAQAWIHYLIMAYFFLLDASTLVSMLLVYAFGDLDRHYRCFLSALLIRLVAHILDSRAQSSVAALKWRAWLTSAFTLPFVIRTAPVYSMLNMTRRIVPLSSRKQSMYVLQESLTRRKTLDWYVLFRTWIVITWSILNAGLLSLQRFLVGFGLFTARFPAKVFAWSFAIMHILAILYIALDWLLGCGKGLRPRASNHNLTFGTHDAQKARVNPIEAKVYRMTKRPYEQVVAGMLSAVNNITQTTSEQVGQTHRQVQTIVTVGAKIEGIVS